MKNIDLLTFCSWYGCGWTSSSDDYNQQNRGRNGRFECDPSYWRYQLCNVCQYFDACWPSFRGTAYVWEQFFNIIEPVAARVPYMTSVGNHEYDHTTGADKDPRYSSVTDNLNRVVVPAWDSILPGATMEMIPMENAVCQCTIAFILLTMGITFSGIPSTMEISTLWWCPPNTTLQLEVNKYTYFALVLAHFALSTNGWSKTWLLLIGRRLRGSSSLGIAPCMLGLSVIIFLEVTLLAKTAPRIPLPQTTLSP